MTTHKDVSEIGGETGVDSVGKLEDLIIKLGHLLDGSPSRGGEEEGEDGVEKGMEEEEEARRRKTENGGP